MIEFEIEVGGLIAAAVFIVAALALVIGIARSVAREARERAVDQLGRDLALLHPPLQEAIGTSRGPYGHPTSHGLDVNRVSRLAETARTRTKRQARTDELDEVLAALNGAEAVSE